jgi:hypothetical protein
LGAGRIQASLGRSYSRFRITRQWNWRAIFIGPSGDLKAGGLESMSVPVNLGRACEFIGTLSDGLCDQTGRAPQSWVTSGI